MTEFLKAIWQNTPVWVWPLFCGLVASGLLAMKNRTSSVIPYYFYPLFGLSAANAISGLVHVPINWVAFGASYMVGAALAFRWQDRLILQKTGRTMMLKGEKVTLLILMVIFSSNFVNGVIEAVAPQIRTVPIFTVAFACVIGLCSGSFIGRAVRVVTLRTRP